MVQLSKLLNVALRKVLQLCNRIGQHKSHNAFKLLYLPSVALRNVLQCMNPHELFELSQCSRKTRFIIPLAGSKNFKLKIDLSFGIVSVNGEEFVVNENRSKYQYIIKGKREFMGKTVKISDEVTKNYVPLRKREMISFWDDRAIGLENVTLHLANLFNCTIDAMIFQCEIPAEVYIDLIISRQSEIKKLDIGPDSLSVEKISKIFDNLKVTDSLTLWQNASTVQSLSFSAKSVEIGDSYWITSVHLASMKNCVVIELRDSSLTNLDMTSFLNDWNSGHYPNLRYLYVRSKNLSEDFTVFGLPSLRNYVDLRLVTAQVLDQYIMIFGTVDVHRDNRVVANIVLNRSRTLELLVL